MSQNRLQTSQETLHFTLWKKILYVTHAEFIPRVYRRIISCRGRFGARASLGVRTRWVMVRVREKWGWRCESKLAEHSRSESRVSSGVGRAFISRTPVVEWSGCGDVYKVPGVAVPQLAVVALCSLVSCTWTNARNEEAVENLAVDRKRSCAVVKCSHVRYIRYWLGFVVPDPRLATVTVHRNRNLVRMYRVHRLFDVFEGK